MSSRRKRPESAQEFFDDDPDEDEPLGRRRCQFHEVRQIFHALLHAYAQIFFETKAKSHSKNADLPLLPRAPFSSLLLLQLLWLLSFQRACQRVSWH